ncbi:NADH:ubiquinone reductase (Na(+)-transporting) subunit F [Nocardia africana]|uniref:Phenol hydroxylase P5 protein n=1 Tax=Nocardia africana TaxID=134964 RepID=A0A378WUL1_9NOCA|nr:2Fe-2S iron-sulfur cluster binding domain-containing protein [Nocardia africana]MCC3313779.1 2Fe-2S iron-sulfur cluster binding domain-containing protein [Nocardia africana]SUA44839.1 Phenol hydroxylase P5 protein [Nocardia africana]
MAETYTISIEPLEREVRCRSDQNILDACLRQGVWLPHACTHGTCSTCKVQVLDGHVEHNDASTYALMDFERGGGKALICTATPRSDVTIEADVEVEEGVEFHPIGDYTGTVVEMADIARGTRRLLIDLDREMAFNAGQYVQVSVPGKGVTRCWSMANPPGQPGRIELQIRNTPGGLATEGWVFDTLAVGDSVRLAGPYGRFFLREANLKPAILIGGGTGLAPLKSIIRHVLESGLPQRLYLYHGARTEADLYDVEFFRELERSFTAQFTYRPCLSEQAVEGFAHGLVTDVVGSDFPTCRGHVAYLCGPPPMVDAAVKTLMGKRLFPRDIFREEFLDASDKATGGLRSPLLKTS